MVQRSTLSNPRVRSLLRAPVTSVRVGVRPNDASNEENSRQLRSFVSGIPSEQNWRTDSTGVHRVHTKSVCFVVGEPERTPAGTQTIREAQHMSCWFVGG